MVNKFVSSNVRHRSTSTSDSKPANMFQKRQSRHLQVDLRQKQKSLLNTYVIKLVLSLNCKGQRCLYSTL